jgi:hypothetical protein
MGNQTDPPDFWPLHQSALNAELLRPFAPLGSKAIAQAINLGFLSQAELANVVKEGLYPSSSAELRTFLKTASYIDRRRDISEELDRLARKHEDAGRPLWMILARLILKASRDPDSAVATLEQLYQWCDTPAALRPYTLYGTSSSAGISRSQELVEGLNAILQRADV